MTDRLARWFVRRHPAWWRRRYEDEVLALLDGARPGAASALDLARSCVHTWTSCRASVAHSGAGARWSLLRALLLAVQLPLVFAVLVIMIAFVLISVMAVTAGRPGGLPVLWLLLSAPIVASGVVALAAGLANRPDSTSHRVTLAAVCAAVVAVLVVMTWGLIDDPRVWPTLWADGPLADRVRSAFLLALAYAASTGLIVRMAFLGLPLGRCVINCVHAGQLEDTSAVR